MRFFAFLLILGLTACVSDQHEAGTQKGEKQDVISQIFYDKLMNQILSQKITKGATGSHFRKGQTIPYRHGMQQAHKAISACLVWDTDAVQVRYRWASFGEHRDWNYAELSATGGCENAKRQKSLNCKCQTLDHDDVNVLQVPTEFRQAYASLEGGKPPATKTKKKTASVKSDKNTRPYDMFLEWEKTLSSLEKFQISVSQIGKKGSAKSISLIAGKTCDASFNFTKGDRGEWSMKCTDGSNAVGVIQALGRDKGSKGSGYDQDGNKLEFRLIPSS
jgi:hypothetical protein